MQTRAGRQRITRRLWPEQAARQEVRESLILGWPDPSVTGKTFRESGSAENGTDASHRVTSRKAWLWMANRVVDA
jgi:hypothetical protein